MCFTVRMRFDAADHEAIREHLVALTPGLPPGAGLRQLRRAFLLPMTRPPC